MKLTKKQKEELSKYHWDIVSNDDGNCAWVNITPEDGVIFGEICEHFDLTGDNGDIKLLVVATREGE